jgi:hypothetical protein
MWPGRTVGQTGAPCETPVVIPGTVSRTIDAMGVTTPRPLTDDERAEGRRWLDNWRVVGAILEEERAERLRTMTDADAARITIDLWRFARPGAGDDAQGLLSMKALLAKAAR